MFRLSVGRRLVVLENEEKETGKWKHKNLITIRRKLIFIYVFRYEFFYFFASADDARGTMNVINDGVHRREMRDPRV